MRPADRRQPGLTRLAPQQALLRGRVTAPHVGNPQRERIVAAMARLASERPEASVTVSRVTEMANVSRHAFYEHFEDCGDCLAAVFDEFVARAGQRVRAADTRQSGWAQRVRAGLLALLEFLDEEPELARVCAARALAGGIGRLTRDGELLSRLGAIVDDGRAESPMRRPPPAGVAESVVGGTLGMIHARLLGEGQPPLVELLNSLMGMIVLPYLGEAAALRELSRPAPEATNARRDPLDGLNMRVTYRTARVLAVVAAEPGLNNREIGHRAGVKDRGQMSRLLGRLRRLQLIETDSGRRGAGANAWRLTPAGEAAEGAIRRRWQRDGKRRLDE
jgi:AcrR family transcriptional regulator